MQMHTTIPATESWSYSSTLSCISEKIMNAKSGQAAWYGFEQNVLLQEYIGDVVNDLEKKETDSFW